MQIETTNLDKVKLIKPATMHEDFRGAYVELYNEAKFHEAGIDLRFVEDDISMSRCHVLRGIHGDDRTWKLVSCLYGSFYLVVVDMDEASPTYRRWQGFTLSETNRLQVLIPPQHGNGHVAMSETVIFHYKQSSYYDRPNQFTILWNDPAFDFWWPIKTPILSRRDDGTDRG
jgi:dTDP-4-dehydrorhamnose 3,5-epimerase